MTSYNLNRKLNIYIFLSLEPNLGMPEFIYSFVYHVMPIRGAKFYFNITITTDKSNISYRNPPMEMMQQKYRPDVRVHQVA